MPGVKEILAYKLQENLASFTPPHLRVSIFDLCHQVAAGLL
jgi:hypothetical protein